MKINIPRKVLYGMLAPFIVFFIGLYTYVHFTSNSKYYSTNPDEALGEFYVALAKYLNDNPSPQFVSLLSEAYKDEMIDDDEFMALATIQIEQNNFITISYEQQIVFDDAKDQFVESWEKYQNENPTL